MPFLKAVPVAALNVNFSLKDPDLGIFSEARNNNDSESRATQARAALDFLAANGMRSNKNVQI